MKNKTIVVYFLPSKNRLASSYLFRAEALLAVAHLNQWVHKKRDSLRSTRIAALVGAAFLFCLPQSRAADDVADSFNPGADHPVRTVVVQADGKVVVGGDFTMLGGGGDGNTPRSHLGRLNPDGSLDTAYDPGVNNLVADLLLQPDGKLLVGGGFTMLGGGGTGTTMRNSLGRLNANGTLDTTFDPDVLGNSGLNGLVNALALQSDGKILVAGSFTTLAGAPRSNLGRLNADGTIDATFNPFVSGGEVDDVAVQADGKIVVGGFFTSLGAPFEHPFIGRLNADGTIDSTFNASVDSNGFSVNVLKLGIQADGKILVGGNFRNANGEPRNDLARFDPSGSLDASFDPGVSNIVVAFALPPDGKIVVGGSFTMLGGGGFGTTMRNHIGRLNQDGTLDTTFDPGANSDVIDFALQNDGKIVTVGLFHTIGGGGMGMAQRNLIARLGADAATDSLPLNISTRLDVLTGDNVLIGGFIITGSDSKQVLLRAIGPSLTDFGLSGVLADPVLELDDTDGVIVTNDNWMDTQKAAIDATGLAPSDNLESAILITLEPGAYTAVLRGNSGGTGIALVEAYDLDSQPAISRMANISTRGFVQTGDNVMIGGFIIGGGGGGPATVIIRAIGPALADFGVANALADPTLDLHDGNGDLIDSNDNWMDGPDMQKIIDDGLAPTDPKESALFGILAPGSYTAILSGKNSSTGVALVEVYDVDPAN